MSESPRASDMALCRAILRHSRSIRYSAVARGQVVVTESREQLEQASAESSDFFEELLVNPALLLLARQRGELDCGGLRHLIVGYGRFNQIVMPLGAGGHLSVAVELEADAAQIAAALEQLLDLERDAGPER